MKTPHTSTFKGKTVFIRLKSGDSFEDKFKDKNMIGTEKEESQKDEVLQKINDLLEELKWGGGCDRLVIRVEFEGRFKLKPFHFSKKICEK